MGTSSIKTTFRLVEEEGHRWSAPLPEGGTVRFGEPVTTPDLAWDKPTLVLRNDGTLVIAYAIAVDCGRASYIENTLATRMKFRFYVGGRMPYGILLASLEPSIESAHIEKTINLSINPNTHVFGDKTPLDLLRESRQIEFQLLVLKEGDRTFLAGRSGRIPQSLLDVMVSAWTAVDRGVPFEKAMSLTLELFDTDNLWCQAECIPAQ